MFKLLLITFSLYSHNVASQELSYLNKQIVFSQDHILINEQILFNYYSVSHTKFEIESLDRQIFVRGEIKEIEGKKVTEYFFPSINLFLVNEKFNDYKDLFQSIIKANVFDVHLSIDQLELIRFVINNKQL